MERRIDLSLEIEGLFFWEVLCVFAVAVDKATMRLKFHPAVWD
jgi:hypothetical protein